MFSWSYPELVETCRNPFLQHSLSIKARGDVHANKCCYDLGCPVGRYRDGTISFGNNGTRQIDKRIAYYTIPRTLQNSQ